MCLPLEHRAGEFIVRQWVPDTKWIHLNQCAWWIPCLALIINDVGLYLLDLDVGPTNGSGTLIFKNGKYNQLSPHYSTLSCPPTTLCCFTISPDPAAGSLTWAVRVVVRGYRLWTNNHLFTIQWIGHIKQICPIHWVEMILFTSVPHSRTLIREFVKLKRNVDLRRARKNPNMDPVWEEGKTWLWLYQDANVFFFSSFCLLFVFFFSSFCNIYVHFAPL